jgi:hypothetical protein
LQFRLAHRRDGGNGIGVPRMILLMWRLRWAYFRGADPADLAVRYGYLPRDE